MSRRIRLDDRHRPRDHGTSLAGRAAGPRVVIMNDLPRDHARRQVRGGRGHVHSIMFLGPCALALDAMPPAKEALVMMARRLSIQSGGHIGRSGRVIRLGRGSNTEHHATEPQAKPCKDTHYGELLSQVRAPCRASIRAEASNHWTNADSIGPAYMVLFTPYTPRGSIPPGPHSCRQNRFTRRNVKSPDARTSRYIP